MKDRIKDIIVITLLLIVIILGGFINVIAKDKNISISERRHLKQFPKIEKFFDGGYSNEFEEYASDQFVIRDNARAIKEFFHFNIYFQNDNNGLFIKDNSIFKQIAPFNEKEVYKAVDKYKKVKEKYFNNFDNVYFSIVPDKNYYLEDNKLNIDYDKLEKIMVDNLNGEMKYIRIFDELNLDSYYRTDSHWKQEKLAGVTNKLLKALGNNTNVIIEKSKLKGKFKGVFASQLVGNNIEDDEIRLVYNNAIENAVTYNYETNEYNKVYDENKWNKSSDKYEIYLSGATPIIEVKNGLNKSNKKLIVFRDSYASSLMPLLLEEYSEIILVDLRYINYNYVGNFVDFSNLENTDILFLNSTLILNEASILK